jgi:Uma2 family endonuclease
MGLPEATIEDLYRVEGKAEIVGGELVLMSAAGGFHGFVTGEIFASLREYGRRTRSGVALGDNVGIIVNLPTGDHSARTPRSGSDR